MTIKMNSIPKYTYNNKRPGSSDFKNISSKKSNKCSTGKTDNIQYTGNELAGIATMHKSNAVPVPKDSSLAKDITKMRRN